jgi:hypothetical protein
VAFTPASLLTTPDMKATIGWKATRRPAVTASHCRAGASSRTVRKAHRAATPASSTEMSRIAASSEKVSPATA